MSDACLHSFFQEARKPITSSVSSVGNFTYPQKQISNDIFAITMMLQESLHVYTQAPEVCIHFLTINEFEIVSREPLVFSVSSHFHGCLVLTFLPDCLHSIENCYVYDRKEKLSIGLPHSIPTLSMHLLWVQ